MRRGQELIAESDQSDDDIVMTSSDDTDHLMSSTSDLTSSDDELAALKRTGPYWGWLVVVSGFYCVAMVGGVSVDL